MTANRAVRNVSRDFTVRRTAYRMLGVVTGLLRSYVTSIDP